MLELLGALEGFAGEMACLRATPEEIDAIRVLTQQMHETYEKDERLSYYKINQSIHRSIVEFSKLDESWGGEQNQVVEAHYSSLEKAESANCADPA